MWAGRALALLAQLELQLLLAGRKLLIWRVPLRPAAPCLTAAVAGEGSASSKAAPGRASALPGDAWLAMHDGECWWAGALPSAAALPWAELASVSRADAVTGPLAWSERSSDWAAQGLPGQAARHRFAMDRYQEVSLPAKSCSCPRPTPVHRRHAPLCSRHRCSQKPSFPILQIERPVDTLGALALTEALLGRIGTACIADLANGCSHSALLGNWGILERASRSSPLISFSGKFARQSNSGDLRSGRLTQPGVSPAGPC